MPNLPREITNHWSHSEIPLVAAPMAGGPTTVALAHAVTAAGGFAFLAAGYKTAAAMGTECEALHAAVGHTRFGVNLFVPETASTTQPLPLDHAKFAAYVSQLEPDAAQYGLTLDPTPVSGDEDFDAKIQYLTQHPVALVSFTFGVPQPDVFAALRAVGTQTFVSVTNPEAGIAAIRAGADGLVVQGHAAGGHSATLDPTQALTPRSTAALVALVRTADPLLAQVPLIAAGGVAGSADIAANLNAGATAVAIGTLLLLADEAGTSATHRKALTSGEFTETALTRVFSGRPARGLHNDFMRRHEESAPDAYPAVHYLTRSLRQAAAAAGDAQRVHLWAGTGFAAAQAQPAAGIVQGLWGGVKLDELREPPL